MTYGFGELALARTLADEREHDVAARREEDRLLHSPGVLSAGPGVRTAVGLAMVHIGLRLIPQPGFELQPRPRPGSG